MLHDSHSQYDGVETVVRIAEVNAVYIPNLGWYASSAKIVKLAKEKVSHFREHAANHC